MGEPTSNISYKSCNPKDVRTLQGYVENPSSAITSGTTYVISGNCFEILSVGKLGGDPPTITFSGGPYNDCRECYGSNYDYVTALDCINDNTYYFQFSGFTEIPLLDEVYFIEINNRGSLYYNCFRIIGYGIFNPEDPVNFFDIINTPILSTGCDVCLNSSFLIYEVSPCLGSTTNYVGLSSNQYIDHLISYTDDLGDQYCGIVGALSTNPKTVTFISDYGLFVDNGGEVTCDECNAQVAEQRILTNCITNEDVIVWNSLFFNGGESSNLSSADGCFSVGDIVTGQTVDINEFLNFDPQPSCQECIQCNGIQYDGVSCNGTGPISTISYSYTGTSVLTDNDYTLTGETNGVGLYSSFGLSVSEGLLTTVGISSAGISYSVNDTITILGSDVGGLTPDDDITITVNSVTTNTSILSYQYLENPVGRIFYDPTRNECYTITSISPPTGYTFTISSLSTFDTCLDCTGSTEHYVWLGNDCDGILGNIAVTTGVGFGIGDIVKVKQGDSDFLCVELNDVYNYGVYGPVNSYNSLTTDSYSTCDECKGTVRIGVSVLSCETNEASYVNIPLNTWYAVAGFALVFEGLILSDYQGNCYRVINSCPINAGGVNLDVQHIFTSCSVCYDYYHPVIHVNQYYETIIVGYLPGSGDTVGEIVTFNTPHPIWTDGGDTRRTLIQDNAITLGGFNGLNN